MPDLFKWHKSLRGQLNTALAVMTLLIFGGGVVAVQTLQETVLSASQLGEDRLKRMAEAQELVYTALDIEHQAQIMLLAENVQDMGESYGKILVDLKTLDALVRNLGQAGSTIAILEFQRAAQFFRGTVHVLATLHEEIITQEGGAYTDEAQLAKLKTFHRNLAQQGSDLLVASEALSAEFSEAYYQSVRQLMNESESRRLIVFGVLAGSLLLAWLVSSRYLGHFVILRLQKVSHYLRHVDDEATGGPRVPVSGDDEIGQMARAVEDYISQRKQLEKIQQEAFQAARFIAVGQLAAGIAHEINTPTQYIGDNLNFIHDIVGQIGRDPACEKWADDLREIGSAVGESQEGVQRITEIVTSMKEFSHPGSSGMGEADINQALETSLTVTRNQWKNLAEIKRDLAPNLPMPRCEISKINQVFLNLIINAAQAIEESGKPYPGQIALSTREDGGWIEIRIADSGVGIPVEVRDRIFDPFFTTKPVGTGTGQGLAICHDIVVVKHGGTIEVGGTPGEGAEFIIRLPLLPPDDGSKEGGRAEIV